MTPRWLREAVKACKEPSSPSFPRKMDRWWNLPVHVEPLDGVTPENVNAWLSQTGRRIEHSSFERHLHGCMAAEGGQGVLFFDNNDEIHVQRFTVAHEMGHFVLEYLLPLERAKQSLGEDIVQVFDRKRALPPVDALYSILSGLPVTQDSLMERSASGEIATGRIDAAEYRADRVAFELLAPAEYVLPKVRGLPRGEAVTVLKTQFELPDTKARAYARILLGAENRGFCIRRYLGGEDDE